MEAAAGYICAFIIGLIMGLMGGGGSILTVPLLVYVMGFNPVTATAYSLFIVGSTAAVGATQNYLKGSLAVKTGLVIAIPSFIAVYLTRRYIIPALPEEIIATANFTLTRGTSIMILFAAIMLMAAISMLTRKITDDSAEKKLDYKYILPAVAFLGVLMGLVDAGGGFLIIPMLVFLGGLNMRKAVGTSLFIIAINSLTGFAGDIQTLDIDWLFLLSFTMLSVFGIFAGNYLQRFVNEKQLKHGFGWFIIIMAAFIFSKEITGF